jgi:hypothetical protein
MQEQAVTSGQSHRLQNVWPSCGNNAHTNLKHLLPVINASSCVSPLCKFVDFVVSFCFIIKNIYFDFVMYVSKMMKRKLEHKGRVFQEKWERTYIF